MQDMVTVHTLGDLPVLRPHPPSEKPHSYSLAFQKEPEQRRENSRGKNNLRSDCFLGLGGEDST